MLMMRMMKHCSKGQMKPSKQGAGRVKRVIRKRVLEASFVGGKRGRGGDS